MKYAAPAAIGGVLYGLGHLIGFFHGKSVERKLTAAAKKVISTAAQ